MSLRGGLLSQCPWPGVGRPPVLPRDSDLALRFAHGATQKYPGLSKSPQGMAVTAPTAAALRATCLGPGGGDGVGKPRRGDLQPSA